MNSTETLTGKMVADALHEHGGFGKPWSVGLDTWAVQGVDAFGDLVKSAIVNGPAETIFVTNYGPEAIASKTFTFDIARAVIQGL